jgi:dolichol-phosphate mannosyltransferase
VVRPRRLGIGSAHRLGWLHARRFGYARLVTLDADLSHDPNDIPRLLEALDTDAEVALGSRFVKGGNLDYRGWRLFMSRAGNRVARRLLGLKVAEYTTSLRAVRLDRVPFGLIETIEENGYAFFLQSVVRLARQGLRVKEIPIHFHERRAGRSKMPRLEILRGMAGLAELFFDRRRFVYEAADDGARSETCRRCGEPYVIAMPTGKAQCLFCAASDG